jgi:hypothetical protein
MKGRFCQILNENLCHNWFSYNNDNEVCLLCQVLCFVLLHAFSPYYNLLFIYLFVFFVFLVFFCSIGVWTQCLILARQAFYHLSTPLALQPLLFFCITRIWIQGFCCSYFGDRILLYAQASLNLEHPILLFRTSLGWQAHATTSSYWLRWGSHELFVQLQFSQSSS